MMKKIFHANFGIALLTAFLSVIVCTLSSFLYMERVHSNNLRQVGETMAVLMEDSVDEQSELAAQRQNCVRLLEEFDERSDAMPIRTTYIAANGDVLYDSEVSAENLDNHGSRPEIVTAQTAGKGESDRYSSTLLRRTSYYAEKLSNGDFIRVGLEDKSVFAFALNNMGGSLLILILVLFLSGAISYKLSRVIIEPLNNLNPAHPEEGTPYPELEPMLRHIEWQNREIQLRIEQIEERRSEFQSVEENLSEGLIILDRFQNVLSMNRAARSFYSIEEVPVGKSMAYVDRSNGLKKALARADELGEAEYHEQRKDRIYDYRIRPVLNGQKKTGYSLLILDITNQERASQLRREFTANVSHELKSPLQAIIGSTELLRSGLVKEEDRDHFLGQIQDSSKRLLELIDDTLRLSRLDEGETLPAENIPVRGCIEEIEKTLRPLMDKKNIKWSLSSDDTIIRAPRAIFYDMLYNIIDNAIKYNKDHGRIDVRVATEGETVRIEVEDTGIGIPNEDRARIFERFYRADKSHSLKTPGTGLGLSIVKHAAETLNGRIEVDSIVGQGTTMRLILPLR